MSTWRWLIDVGRNLAQGLWQAWWEAWTGDKDEHATRNRLEHEVRRFNGEINWRDGQ